VFGSTMAKIDFDWIDFVELILIKHELSVKWFMFGCFKVEVIYMKDVVWIFCVKIAFGYVNYQNGF